MKALPTQFDDRRLSTAVATPTCSSCCCCCCCLATSIASSSLLTQRVGKEGEKHQVPNRHLLTAMAALFVPIVGLLVYFGFWTINSLLSTCTTRTYEYSSTTYSICTNPGSSATFPLLIIAPVLVLWFLYKKVRIPNPLGRAFLVTFLIAIAFIGELFGGAALILTGVGGIIYLFMIPVVIGWITVWYHRHLIKETQEETTATTPEKPHEQPPQPTTPAPSGQ